MKSTRHNCNPGRKPDSFGFTIVELLVVIVVVAILAAISIVAYNGIQDRARRSSASSSLSQAIKKIKLWQIDNSSATPTTLAEAGISNTDGSTYNYRRFDGNTNYCVSITSNGRSYYATSIAPDSVAQGSCSDPISVVGPPLASISTSSTTASFPSVTGTPNLIMYVVYDITNIDGNYNVLAKLQPLTATNQFQMDTNATGVATMRYRLDTTATTNASAGQSGVRTPGRHIGWLQVRSNMTIREFAYDQAAAANSASLNPGDGWNFSSIILGPATSSTQPVAAMVYNDTHDQQTRARVMQYLADTYGVAATY
jgi:prepilin-type N-terminal cleavage/methylation domain-containing protein